MVFVKHVRVLDISSRPKVEMKELESFSKIQKVKIGREWIVVKISLWKLILEAILWLLP